MLQRSTSYKKLKPCSKFLLSAFPLHFRSSSVQYWQELNLTTATNITKLKIILRFIWFMPAFVFVYFCITPVYVSCVYALRQFSTVILSLIHHHHRSPFSPKFHVHSFADTRDIRLCARVSSAKKVPTWKLQRCPHTVSLIHQRSKSWETSLIVCEFIPSTRHRRRNLGE